MTIPRRYHDYTTIYFLLLNTLPALVAGGPVADGAGTFSIALFAAATLLLGTAAFFVVVVVVVFVVLRTIVVPALESDAAALLRGSLCATGGGGAIAVAAPRFPRPAAVDATAVGALVA